MGDKKNVDAHILNDMVESWQIKKYPGFSIDPDPDTDRPPTGHETLNHKRTLALKMNWRLHKGQGIPVESLMRQQENQSTPQAA